MDNKYFSNQNIVSFGINNIISFNYYEKNSFPHSDITENDFFELIYVDSGHLDCTVDGKNYTINKDEIMIVFPHQIYQKKYTNPLVSFLTLSFSTDNENTLHLLKNKLFISNLFLKNVYLHLLAENTCRDEYSFDVLIGCLYQILPQLLRQCREENANLMFLNMAEKNTTSNKTVNFMIDFINQNIDKNVSLSDVSEALNLNPSHISRLFKKYTGVCMTRYILLKKLRLSKLLLLSNNFTVTKISDMLGFSSVHYFSNCFKKEFGISPGMYSHTKDDIS